MKKSLTIKMTKLQLVTFTSRHIIKHNKTKFQLCQAIVFHLR